MCTTQKPATVNELLFKAECCSNCGIPIKAADGTQLHAGVPGKYCTFPRHFLEVGAFVVKGLGFWVIVRDSGLGNFSKIQSLFEMRHTFEVSCFLVYRCKIPVLPGM
jgi:hypothetical protein